MLLTHRRTIITSCHLLTDLLHPPHTSSVKMDCLCLHGDYARLSFVALGTISSPTLKAWDHESESFFITFVCHVCLQLSDMGMK